MNCREFEQAWNDRLDRPATPAAGWGEAAEAHEAECPECGLLGAGYRALLSALGEPPSPVDPPAGFSDRVLARAAMADRHARRLRLLRRLVPLATAAALAAAVAAWPRRPGAGPSTATDPSPATVAIDPGDLTAALSDVGAASLSLAREASAPAARVGGDVIGVAGWSEGVASIALPVPAVAREGTSLWEGVGGRVTASAGPLTGTTRSAFGFLLGGPPEG